MIVIPEMDAVTPPSTSNTRPSPPPLTVTPTLGPVIVCLPVVSLRSSRLPEALAGPIRLIVCGVLKSGPKLMVFAWLSASAWASSYGSEPGVLGFPLVLVTVNVDSSLRSSSTINFGRSRCRFRPATVRRAPLR